MSDRLQVIRDSLEMTYTFKDTLDNAVNNLIWCVNRIEELQQENRSLMAEIRDLDADREDLEDE